MKNKTWAFIGCGWAGGDMAQKLVESGRRINGLYSRNFERASEFAKKYGIDTVYERFDALCRDESIENVYIATPHSVHAQHIKACLLSGKNVLCEKAIVMNISQLDDLCGIANERSLRLAEAMTVYNMPLHRQLSERVKGGAFGKVNLIQVNFGSTKPYDMSNRFFSMEYAGGAMLDIGVYALALESMYSTGEICSIDSNVTKAPSAVDESFGAVIKRCGGQISTVTVSLHSKLPKRAVISCDDAYIEIQDYPRADKALIVYNDGKTEVFSSGKTSDALLYEIQAFENGSNMHFENTYSVMKSMTYMREKWGLHYPCED